MACLHGWPPNAGTGNPTRRIPANPHTGVCEQDLPGDHHRSSSEQDGRDDMAEQTCRVVVSMVATIAVSAACVVDAGLNI